MNMATLARLLVVVVAIALAPLAHAAKSPAPRIPKLTGTVVVVNQQSDSITLVAGATNVVLDHCSASWSHSR